MMRIPDSEARVVLIGGTSHVGKSTVAGVIAGKLGAGMVSTDFIARHPGRPWKTAPAAVPAHVAEHYLGLGVKALVADVLRHYRVNIWPRVEGILRAHVAAGKGVLVVEGSAIWPEFVGGMEGVAGVWLTASEAVIERRIRNESGYEGKDARGREMIEKFLARTVRFNALMMEAVRKLGLASVRVEEGMRVEELADLCLSRAG